MGEPYVWTDNARGTCGIRGCTWQGAHIHRDDGRGMSIGETGSIALMAQRQEDGTCPHCGCSGAMMVCGVGGSISIVLRCHRCGMDRAPVDPET